MGVLPSCKTGLRLLGLILCRLELEVVNVSHGIGLLMLVALPALLHLHPLDLRHGVIFCMAAASLTDGLDNHPGGIFLSLSLSSLPAPTPNSTERDLANPFVTLDTLGGERKDDAIPSFSRVTMWVAAALPLAGGGMRVTFASAALRLAGGNLSEACVCLAVFLAADGLTEAE